MKMPDQCVHALWIPTYIISVVGRGIDSVDGLRRMHRGGRRLGPDVGPHAEIGLQ